MRRSQQQPQQPKKFKRCQPASGVIDQFGGHEAVADIVGLHPTSVYRWTCSVERGGTGGRIPQQYFPALIKVAKYQNIDLTINDLVQA